MAARLPVVMIGGQLQNLPAGDTLNAPVSEVDVITPNNGESATAITIGMPVYVSAANAVKRAQANASGTTRVIGLMKSASIAAGASSTVQTDGVLTSTDWTAVVGATALTAGAQYFLSATTPGQLTTTSPATTGTYSAPVGTALSTTDFEIAIQPTFLN